MKDRCEEISGGCSVWCVECGEQDERWCCGRWKPWLEQRLENRDMLRLFVGAGEVLEKEGTGLLKQNATR